VFGRQVSRQCRDKARELRRVTHTTGTDSFEENSHRFLVEVLHKRRLISRATKDGSDAPTKPAHQFGFAQRIPGPDAFD
jgi:hypothetical protein